MAIVPFQSGTALVRAVARDVAPFLALPDLDDHSRTGTEAQLAWLRVVRDDADLAEALEHATPDLSEQVRRVCQSRQPRARDVRRVTVSVARYLLRARHRPTPFGLFAGVTTAAFGGPVRAEWGSHNTVVARAGAGWLAAVVKRLEACPDLLERLPVQVNDTTSIRGSRLVVPYSAFGPAGHTRPVEASVALTGPVRMVLTAARTPVLFAKLAAELTVEYPGTDARRIRRLLAELVAHRILLTGLHAPSTTVDPLGHLLRQLEAADAAGLAPLAQTVRELHAVHAVLRSRPARTDRAQAARRMRALAPEARRHPLALDLRLDADIVLPHSVADEARHAAWALSRLCAHPHGNGAWGAYHQRFFERYGVGTMVPLREVVADSGVGYPDGYPGAPAAPGRSRLTERDDILLRIAQSAVLDASDEVVITEHTLAALDSASQPRRLPPHLEITARVHARSLADLRAGRFRLEVVSLSRGAGVASGRFLSVLAPEGSMALAADLAALPASDPDTLPVQLSFPPLLAESAHVTRTPQVLPTVLSINEHRSPVPAEDVITLDEVAVACDGHRMYLAAPGRGQRIEPVGMHALNLRAHTPPLVRFLAELPRAHCAQLTAFDWGAASAMPYLPRLRYRRTVLVAARWRLEASEPLDRAPSRDDWHAGLMAWRTRWRVPQQVFLVDNDRRLHLDLDQEAHRVLLRRHLERAGTAILEEAPAPEDYGWCGGRAHEIVLPLRSDQSPAWPPLPTPAPTRVLTSAQTQTPAVSGVLLAAVYGDPRRQDELLAEHLPVLLDRLEHLACPAWWFIRFRDPGPHLRLRFALPGPDAFGRAARAVAAWADELRVIGLVADLRFPTSYRETGRWGSGAAWDAAENVFGADSRAVLTQLRQPHRPHQRALVAAHITAIATAFLGGVEEGMRWLIDHVPAPSPAPVPRSQFREAVHLADPADGWATLRAVPGGAAIVDAWGDRDAALSTYRDILDDPGMRGFAVDDVLGSLLHMHFVRHVAVASSEEKICLYLARAAALAWAHTRTGVRW